MKAENGRILASRWPVVLAAVEQAPAVHAAWIEGSGAPSLGIDGVQLWSAFDSRAEAKLLASLVAAPSKRACVYGISHGDLIRALLARETLEALRVVVLNPGVAACVLSTFDQSDWLVDPRIELVCGDRLRELEPPIAVAPGEIRLPTDETARLCDLVRLELRTPHARRHQRALAATVGQHVASNRGLLASDPDVARLFGSLVGGTARVAAAGPTLSAHFERLRGESGALIAVDAALKPLLQADIRPDFVVSIDAHEDGMRRVFDVDHAVTRDIGLVYFPAVLNAVLGAWTGPRFAAYGVDALYDALAAAVPKARLWSCGSVLHPAVDLAVRLGAARIELYGADFANLGGRSHVSGAAWETVAGAGAHGSHVLNGHAVRIPSQPNLVGYLRDLERYIGQHPEVRFVNASRAGAHIEGASLLENSHVR